MSQRGRVPAVENKHDFDPLFTAGDLIDYRRSVGSHYPDVPESVILCYDRALWGRVQQRAGERSADGAFERGFRCMVTIGDVGVLGGFGLGAPIAALVLEELVALGATTVLSIGTAGALLPELAIGDILVCTEAIRDEGTSYHYLAPDEPALPCPDTTAALRDGLDSPGDAVTWTTDALYRETREEVLAHAEAGVSCVDMEAAALFAVASQRPVALAAGFVISDTLAGGEWQPHLEAPHMHENLDRLLDASLVVASGS